MPLINYDIKQGEDDWYAAKVGKPSASNASKLVTSTGAPSKSMSAYANELAGELFAGKSLTTFGGTDSTRFGNDTEEEARLAYSMAKDCEVKQCGFIQDDMQRVLVSPDGLIGDDGLVEIKCKPKHHITTLIYYKKHGRVPTDYISQTQMQLHVSERAWCDLFYYHPDLPTLIVRQYPDQKIIDGLKGQIAACLAERDIIHKLLKEF